MDQIDTCFYYAARARTERAMAQASGSPLVAAVHAEMAELYDDRAANLMAGMSSERLRLQAA